MDTDTMPDRWRKQRILSSSYAFRILKIISSEEGGSYATEINELIEKNDREEVSRVISRFEELGLIKKGKRSRAQYYQLRPRGLTQILCELWGIEFSSKKTDQVLEKYLRNYESAGANINGFLKRDIGYAVDELNLDQQNEMIGLKRIEGTNDYKNPSAALGEALNTNTC